MVSRLALLAVVAVILLTGSNAETPAERAAALIKQMNMTEKIMLVHGTTGPYVGNIAGIPRLKIPPILMNDGPQGFRGIPGTSTAFPSGLTAAATWDVNAMFEWGNAMGEEFRGKGANVQLGPGLCLARVPQCGRNFEYLSGEDPYLGNTLVRPVVQAIQTNGVVATSKHYINNNEETNRGFISENVDERTEFEMYLPPFHGAVDAGTLAIMCSYNKINNTWSCENEHTLNGNLKKTAGFEGWVMSDWGGTHSTVESAMAGLDQEMPDDKYFGAALQAAVESGKVPESVLDDKLQRILTSMISIGAFDRPSSGSITANVTSVAHNQFVRALAAQATVLLKNDDETLPLKVGTSTKIAVIGDACEKNVIVAGNGSGHVDAPYVITPLQGITNRAGTAASVTYAPTSPQSAAVAAAKGADIAIVCTATVSGEGSDRVNLSLPYDEDELIAAVAAAQPNTVVQVTNPGAVLMPWKDSVKSIIMNFMPGQEAGNAIADVLFGLENPSARLPLTMPNKENEVGFTQAQYPGLPASNPSEANYTEKLLVGYRWYAANKVTPAFPFGHGLSYTSFTYSNLVIAQVGGMGSDDMNDPVAVVQADIVNSGSYDGAEVAQLYLGFPSSSGEPPIQLKGFQRIQLSHGQIGTVTFVLTQRDVAIWDVTRHAWAPQSGTFTINVGASSADTRLTGTLKL